MKPLIRPEIAHRATHSTGKQKIFRLPQKRRMLCPKEQFAKPQRPLREICNEKPEGNYEQKGVGQERNETAHFVSLPTEGFLFICLVFLFFNMISGSRVMAIVFGHKEV